MCKSDAIDKFIKLKDFILCKEVKILLIICIYYQNKEIYMKNPTYLKSS